MGIGGSSHVRRVRGLNLSGFGSEVEEDGGGGLVI